MAKVKIQGHASGTGVLTVTAPNTSTDRTITLPDGTGTLIADDGSGNVNIGTTGTTAKLEVQKSGVVNAQISNATNGHYFVSQSDDNTDGFEIYQQHGTNTTRNNFIVNDNRTGSKSSAFRVRNDGLTIHGGGLTFNGETATDNTLDDYEEGIHVVTATDTGGGATYGLNSAYDTFAYTKIGRLVTITGTLVNSTVTGTPSGTVALSLPFTCANLTDQAGKAGGAGIGYFQVQKYTSGDYPQHSIAEGDDVVLVRYGVVDSNQYNAYFNTSSQLYCNFSYFTTA